MPQDLSINEAEDLKALQELLADESQLQRLDALLKRLNIFEAVGLVRQEIKHSHFLAFLLKPRESHGLGDTILKGLLQKALEQDAEKSVPVSVAEVAQWNLTATVVQTEWKRIDILARNETHRLLVVVENKIDIGEHSDQLARYLDVVKLEFPGWRVIPIFLTPEGYPASDDRYMALSYGMVVEVIETICSTRASQMAPDIQMLMNHYTQLLRRHIVSGSEVDILCWEIYRKHRRALDAIFERMPDKRTEISTYLQELVKSEPNYMVDRVLKNGMSFLPNEWDVQQFTSTKGWTGTGRMFLFWFENTYTRIALQLVVGPGRATIRRGLSRMARTHGATFCDTTYGDRILIYDRTILSGDEITTMDLEEIKEKIRDFWDQFLDGDLVVIRQAVKEAFPGVDTAN